jgi:hypothetical protein
MEQGYLNDTALGYGLDDQGFESRQGLGIFLFTTTPRPAQGSPSHLSNGYQRLFPWGYSGRVMKLITHLHLVPRSKNE